MSSAFESGDIVVYRVTKYSNHPGPRAQGVKALPKGENYCYAVDKYWVVATVEQNGHLRLRTRTGKEHLVDPRDRNLRHANIWERWFKRDRFPEIDLSESLIR